MQKEWEGWIEPKIILRYFETILRQNLLFSVAFILMLGVSFDNVKFIFKSQEKYSIFNNNSSSPNGLLTQSPWGREE